MIFFLFQTLKNSMSVDLLDFEGPALEDEIDGGPPPVVPPPDVPPPDVPVKDNEEDGEGDIDAEYARLSGIDIDKPPTRSRKRLVGRDGMRQFIGELKKQSEQMEYRLRKAREMAASAKAELKAVLKQREFEKEMLNLYLVQLEDARQQIYELTTLVDGKGRVGAETVRDDDMVDVRRQILELKDVMVRSFDILNEKIQKQYDENADELKTRMERNLEILQEVIQGHKPGYFSKIFNSNKLSEVDKVRLVVLREKIEDEYLKRGRLVNQLINSKIKMLEDELFKYYKKGRLTKNKISEENKKFNSDVKKAIKSNLVENVLVQNALEDIGTLDMGYQKLVKVEIDDFVKSVVESANAKRKLVTDIMLTVVIVNGQSSFDENGPSPLNRKRKKEDVESVVREPKKKNVEQQMKDANREVLIDKPKETFKVMDYVEKDKDMYFVMLVAGELERDTEELVNVEYKALVGTVGAGTNKKYSLKVKLKNNLLAAWASVMGKVMNVCVDRGRSKEDVFDMYKKNDEFIQVFSSYCAYMIMSKPSLVMMDYKSSNMLQSQQNVEFGHQYRLMKVLKSMGKLHPVAIKRVNAYDKKCAQRFYL